VSAGRSVPPEWLPGALLVDLYELTMAESLLAEGMAEYPATFSLFARSLPPGWGYLVAAGLDDALDYLAGLRFEEDDLAWLQSTGRFGDRLLDRLRSLRFTGSVRAVPEGTHTGPDTPLLEVTAPFVEAQIAESVVINQIHLQSLIATKAARCVAAASGRPLVDFALRRTHGADAAMKVARASYLAGFAATSNVLAGRRYGIPLAGTMAHSYVQAFPDESSAFAAFARAYPDGAVLLVDTYDSVGGSARAADVGADLAARGHALRGVRLDSGDLDGLARAARHALDARGLEGAIVFASGGLDEWAIAALVACGAPIDSFGVGTRFGVAADHPYLDMAYKLVEVDGRPTLKLSTGKATWPGAKQVWRPFGGPSAGADALGLAVEAGPPGARPLLETVMSAGRRRAPADLDEARRRCAEEQERLPRAARALDATSRPLAPTLALRAARDRIAADLRRRHAIGPREPSLGPTAGPS
jgi:nicotinate phosphoribosyltransferase